VKGSLEGLGRQVFKESGVLEDLSREGNPRVGIVGHPTTGLRVPGHVTGLLQRGQVEVEGTPPYPRGLRQLFGSKTLRRLGEEG
jgi:hypothetical protein